MPKRGQNDILSLSQKPTPKDPPTRRYSELGTLGPKDKMHACRKLGSKSHTRQAIARTAVSSCE